MGGNLYVHFPFCRRKCSYCALHSRAGVPVSALAEYVTKLAQAVSSAKDEGVYATVYFGGGSPGLCDLRPLFRALEGRLKPQCEFTVELHPLDVTRERLHELKAGGVNRISMGVQSLDDAVLADMGRGYTFVEAERAFYLVREEFENAGIDLIVGYPGESAALLPRHARLAKWKLAHCSAYSLIRESATLLDHRLKKGLGPKLPDDDTVMNHLAVTARFLESIGLKRYEISNYAVPGFECRHNLAVWRGEDYWGLGEGACGRVGLRRTRNAMQLSGENGFRVCADFDRRERALFRLRTREGLETAGFPQWRGALDKFVAERLLTREGSVYRLTERGTEVCDSILREIVAEVES